MIETTVASNGQRYTKKGGYAVPPRWFVVLTAGLILLAVGFGVLGVMTKPHGPEWERKTLDGVECLLHKGDVVSCNWGAK